MERSLQNSEAHIEAGQSLRFSFFKVWCTFGLFRDVWQGMGSKLIKKGVIFFMDGPWGWMVDSIKCLAIPPTLLICPPL